MTKIKQLPSRSAVLLLAAILTLFGIGLVAITHADERGERPDRPEREGRLLGIGAFGNVMAKFNLHTPDLRVRVGVNDNVQIHGATVSATSSSGFTALANTPPLVFNVQTDASTKFNVKGMGSGSIANIAVGDIVNFRGIALSGTTTSTWMVKASGVEDKTRHQKPPKPMASTVHLEATTTAQIQITALTEVIARLEAIVAQLKIRFGL